MPVYTHLTPPGFALAEAAYAADGALIFGRGTTLTPRHLTALIEEGVTLIEVEPTGAQPEIPPWIEAPELSRWLEDLERRFERVKGDRRMNALKQALRKTMEARR
ncbi:MAG: hypothetical protein ACE366_25875 [Bradymonadia bacterium]